MSRQSCALLLALALSWPACADVPTEPVTQSTDSSVAAPVEDAKAPVDSRTTDAAANRPGSPRPSVLGSDRDAGVADARAADGGGSRGRDAGTLTARDAGGSAVTPDAAVVPSTGVWKPQPGTRWQWDLTGDVTPLDVAAEVYDIDGFETDAALVAELHAMGKKVICYLSVGTYEPERADAKDFPKEGLGKYWPEWGETYIDIRSEAVRAVIRKRLEMCKTKGFDAIEPDNMDMFEGGMSDTGFPLTEEDGVAYAKWLANEAHALGLSIGQKNASSITSEIEALYDWALTEDCFADGWCDDMNAYPEHGKALFMCEYTDTQVDFVAACGAASQHEYSAILKNRDLDSWVQFCQ